MKLFNRIRFASIIPVFLLLSVSPVCVYAQKESIDNKFLDEFIASQGYKSTIIFDASNIKQFWIDNTVMTKDGEIVVLLSSYKQKFESSFHKIQLANVDKLLDCKIDVITNDSGLSFSIVDKASKVLSTSASKEDFIQSHIISASFHLEDVPDYSFSLKFFSNESSTANIKKIVLSFAHNNNSSFLTSPGVLHIGTDDVTLFSGTTIKKDTDNKKSFFVTGKTSKFFSNKKIFISDNVLKGSASFKNVGKTPTYVYLAYAPYTKDGILINCTVTPYNNNHQVLRVLSHEKDSNKVVVDSYPEEWTKGCFLALNAKEDLSDFPNTHLVGSKILEINKISDNHVEIVFEKNVAETIEPGMLVRIQAPHGAPYMYPVYKLLEPGEEIKLTTTLQKNDTLYGFSGRVFCKGTEFVVPMIISISKNPDDENTVLISDFTVSY